jgi:hypothetical protein
MDSIVHKKTPADTRALHNMFISLTRGFLYTSAELKLMSRFRCESALCKCIVLASQLAGDEDALCACTHPMSWHLPLEEDVNLSTRDQRLLSYSLALRLSLHVKCVLPSRAELEQPWSELNFKPHTPVIFFAFAMHFVLSSSISLCLRSQCAFV